MGLVDFSLSQAPVAVTKRVAVAWLLLLAPYGVSAATFELITATDIQAVIQPNGYSSAPRDASSDGRYAVFDSATTNFGPLPASAYGGYGQSIFLFDAQTNAMETISVRESDGLPEPFAYSSQPTVSGDGRFVAFTSCGTFDPTLTGSYCGVFLRDRQLGTTRLVSTDPGRSQFPYGYGAVLARSGSHVVFVNSVYTCGEVCTSTASVYRKTLPDGALEVVSLGNDGQPLALSDEFGIALSLSADGSQVAMLFRDDVPALGDTDDAWDVYVRDTLSGTLELATVDAGGQNQPQPVLVGSGDFYPLLYSEQNYYYYPQNVRWLSDDGQRLVFSTSASLVPEDVARGYDEYDAYLRDRSSSETVLVSKAADGTPGNGGSLATSISGDGNRVAMKTFAGNLDPNFAIHWSSGAVKVLDTAAFLPVVASESGPSCCMDYFGDLLLSGDGSKAFYQSSDRLVAADRNLNYTDNYRTDLAGDPIHATLITRPDSSAQNVAAAADQSVGYSGYAVSDDGRFAVFTSYAGNLVAGDSAYAMHTYLRDRETGQTQRLGPADPSSNCRYSYGADITPDGRYVVFAACGDVTGEGNLGLQIYRYDRIAGSYQLVSRTAGVGGSVGDSSSFYPKISTDGNRVAFSSYAQNLDDTPPGCCFPRVFVRDLTAGLTRRVSRTADGSDVANASFQPHFSGDGRFVLWETSQAAHPDDADSSQDAYLTALDAALNVVGVELASVGPDNPGLFPYALGRGISADGSRLLFYGAVNTSYGLYVRDRITGAVQRADLGNDRSPLFSSSGDLSADGRFVTFSSYTCNFVAGEGCLDGQVFVRDLEQAVTVRASVRNDGTVANRYSDSAAISANGRWLLFASSATNLVEPDGNGVVTDLFLTENPLFGGEVVSDVDTITPATTEPSLEAAVGADGRFVVFESLDPAVHAPCPEVPNPPALCAAGCPATGPLYVFRLDTQLGCTDLVSVNDDETVIKMLARAKGASGGDPDLGKPSLSANGTLVAFVADNASVGKLLGESTKAREKRQKLGGFAAFFRNMTTGSTQFLGGVASAGTDTATGQPLNGGRPQVSATGNATVFTGVHPFSGKPSVYFAPTASLGLPNYQPLCVSCKRPDGKRASTKGFDFTEPLAGFAQNPAISAEGTFVAYETVDTSVADTAPSCDNGAGNTMVMMRNMATGGTRALSQPQGTPCQQGSAGKAKLDFSGNKVVFQSTQPLKPGATARAEAYLLDLASNALIQVSTDGMGGQVDAPSGEPTLSGDGKLIAFTSRAQGFAANPDPTAPAVQHIVVRELRSNAVRRLSKNPNGLDADGDSFRPSLSYTGEFVVFDSQASNLSAADANGSTSDVFLRVNPTVNQVVFGSGFE